VEELGSRRLCSHARQSVLTSGAHVRSTVCSRQVFTSGAHNRSIIPFLSTSGTTGGAFPVTMCTCRGWWCGRPVAAACCAHCARCVRAHMCCAWVAVFALTFPLTALAFANHDVHGWLCWHHAGEPWHAQSV